MLNPQEIQASQSLVPVANACELATLIIMNLHGSNNSGEYQGQPLSYALVYGLVASKIQQKLNLS